MSKWRLGIAVGVMIVAALRGRRMIADPRFNSGPDSPTIRPAIQEVLEPLNQEVLVKRSLETFPAGYLNHVSIIQGVALGLLVQQTFEILHKSHTVSQWMGVAGQATFIFCCILIVSYEYLWFLTIMRWTPRFRDTLVPLLLGVSEIAPIFLLGDLKGWLVAVAIFSVMGAAAFGHTLSNLEPALFPENEITFTKVRRLLRSLIGFCLVATVATGTYASLGDGLGSWIPTAYPWILAAIFPILVVVNENALDRIYATFNLRRRLPRRPGSRRWHFLP